MSYSTVTSIVILLPGLPNTDTDADFSVTAQIVSNHVTRADSIINSKIAKRYSVPIDPTPPVLRSISQDLASAFSYRSFYTQDNYY